MDNTQSHNTATHAVYYAAIDADTAFNAALNVQFGTRRDGHTQRWSHDYKSYNSRTKCAYARKLFLDNCYMSTFEHNVGKSFLKSETANSLHCPLESLINLVTSVDELNLF